jgi:hypothetical protein
MRSTAPGPDKLQINSDAQTPNTGDAFARKVFSKVTKVWGKNLHFIVVKPPS